MWLSTTSSTRKAGDVESVQLSHKQRLTAGLLGSSDSWGGYTFKFLFSQFFASREALVWRHDSCWWPTGLCNLEKHREGDTFVWVCYITFTAISIKNKQGIRHCTYSQIFPKNRISVFWHGCHNLEWYQALMLNKLDVCPSANAVAALAWSIWRSERTVGETLPINS